MIRYFIITTCLLAGLLIYAAGVRGPVRNHVPDLAWAYALCQTVRLLQENRFQPVFAVILLLMPVLTELGQSGIFPGTFDPLDLLIYAGLYILFFHSQIMRVCKKLQRLLSVPW